MLDLRFHLTRRRALTTLLLLLLLAPIPLMSIAAQLADPRHPQSDPAVGWLLIVAILMGSAVRGDRSALRLWATSSAVIGVALVISSFSAQHGTVRFLDGLIGIAISIVFALLRDELVAETDPATSSGLPRETADTPG
jgi:uncharacterized membrane protein YccC